MAVKIRCGLLLTFAQELIELFFFCVSFQNNELCHKKISSMCHGRLQLVCGAL